MKRNSEIKELFLKHFDKPTTELKFSNLYELLVCVMLSAQCTDKRVNLITPELFKAYPDITSLANANLSSLKTYIQSCSFIITKPKISSKWLNQSVKISTPKFHWMKKN